MKLLKIHVSGYKNLKDVEIDFSNSDRCALIIGTNGSGKSNLLEVFSAIFSACYNKDKNVKPNFRFELEYIIERMRTGSFGGGFAYDFPVNVRIRNVDGTIEIQCSQGGAKFVALEKNQWDIVLPEHTIAIYSGEEKRLWEDYYYASYLNYNKQFIDNRTSYQRQKMIYINKYYWDLVVAILAISIDDASRKFIYDVFGSEIEAIYLKFDLAKIKGNKNPMAQEILDFINPEKKPELIIPIEKFKDVVDLCGYEEDVFYNLIVLCLYSQYKIITEFIVITASDINVKDLSEGEKKLLLIKGITNIIRGENLFLLDEPDAHLHEARKKEILDSMHVGEDSQFIITSHSPKLIKSLPYKNQVILRQGDNQIEAVSANDFSIIASIIDSDITFEEEFAIKEARKPLLLVEGKTDKKHLTAAWEKLYPDQEMPFSIISLSCAEKVRQFILSVPDLFAKSTMVGLVDNDSAGQKVKSGCQEITSTIYKFNNDNNQIRKAYCTLIPFVDDKVKLFNYCPIEFLYDIDVLLENDVVEKSDYRDTMPKWIQSGLKSIDEETYKNLKEICFFRVKESAKNRFADNVTNLNKDAFLNFTQIFDTIKYILQLDDV